MTEDSIIFICHEYAHTTSEDTANTQCYWAHIAAGSYLSARLAIWGNSVLLKTTLMGDYFLIEEIHHRTLLLH